MPESPHRASLDVVISSWLHMLKGLIAVAAGLALSGATKPAAIWASVHHLTVPGRAFGAGHFRGRLLGEALIGTGDGIHNTSSTA